MHITFNKLVTPLIYPPSFEDIENMYTYLWYRIIWNALETFGMYNTSLSTLEFDHTSEQTSTGKLSK